ncbi:MAG TPA: glycoside hydrolase family 3 C-terminal domain-containing protein [Acidimicrobiales bacterium]|nr:glycoside hydrolase family 3 C-terminal domain-containing protein [Acidimicrobiales bacterium]
MSSSASNRARCRRAAALTALAALAPALLPAAAGATALAPPAIASRAVRCPWTTAAAGAQSSPAVLAREVVARMTLAEKIRFVDLAAGLGYENRNTGVPRLCIPMLTLEDGPNGIAYNDRGVTQLPASLGLAATFDPALAREYGAVIGEEAHAQGVDVVQGPNLNLDRVPTSGRAFEAYGEDPYLTSVMGVADIEGIQSAHVMADAKHFTAYTQETDRLHLDQVIPARALEELYLAPFRAAVTEGHVASVMCAYGQINGRYVCQDPSLFSTLKRAWGFQGFVRSDLGAVEDPVAAFDAGLDALKPAATAILERAVTDGALPMPRLDDAVGRIVKEMFAYGLVAHPPTGHPDTPVTDAAASAVALRTAERSVVLLKNAKGVLPLSGAADPSVAVIGADAAEGASTAGFGSAHVLTASVITPLGALRRWLGGGVAVGYEPGGPRLGSSAVHLALNLLVPRIAPAGHAFAPAATLGVSPLSPGYDSAEFAATATTPGSGAGWYEAERSVSPAHSGLYTMSVTGGGDSFVYLGGSLVFADRGIHGRSSWSTPLTLVAGRPTSVRLRWFARPGIETPSIGLTAVGTLISRAVALARRSAVAVVFADDYSSEGVDRPGLDLPGDQNALISAVAAANPRTVVVLNTGGPVLMPWLSKVAGVVEAWYPGQSDGTAVAAVLTGKVDPSGRLPVTFPRGNGADAVLTAASWPGVAGRVQFGPGLALGYRSDEELHERPLFAFGAGLSYTSFALSSASVAATGGGATATVTVTNTGHHWGTAVVEGYIGFPASAGEPPRQLASFGRAHLAPGQSTTLQLPVSGRAFLAWLGGRFQSVAGEYTLSLGWSSRDLPVALTLPAPGRGAPTVSLGGAPPALMPL